MQEFPTNSHNAPVTPERQEKVQQVTSGATVRRKRGVARQFKETFVQGDIRTAVSSVALEILVPSVKELVFEMFETGMRALIFGDDAKRRPSSVNSGYANLGHVAYNRMATPAVGAPSAERVLSRRARARHDFGEIIIHSRDDANEVIDTMFDIVSRYGQVSIAALYEMVGVQSAMTDMKWGWTNLQGSKAVRNRQNEYQLQLPEPVELA